MTNKTTNKSSLAPTLMVYVVMGFVDIIGVSTGYIKNDFQLDDKIAQLLPSLVFVWFFIFSVPAGILLERYGKKKILNIGMLVSGLSMVIPILFYSFESMICAFVLLGIGNTVVQVAANPLLHDVVSKDKFSSYMSLSQFIKACCSLAGPIIAVFMSVQLGDWKLVFLVYAFVTLLTILWLSSTAIKETKSPDRMATFSSCFSLLKKRSILLLVLGIFVVVGAEVGMKTNIANLLQGVHNLSLDNASLAISIFFSAQMIGRFIGAISLRFVAIKYFFRTSTILSLIGLFMVLFMPGVWSARIGIFVIGLGTSNIFPLIFSIAAQKLPARVNEISGLMIMAIIGGAIIPPFMGLVSSTIGVLESFYILLIAFIYLLTLSLYSKTS
ncbi:MAG: MFS transporter [Flavobacteriaceae bacterium]